MIIYRQVIVKYLVYTHNTWVMGVFNPFLKIFLVLSPFCWIRIRNEFFLILDPDQDLYQNDTDPPHCRKV